MSTKTAHSANAAGQKKETAQNSTAAQVVTGITVPEKPEPPKIQKVEPPKIESVISNITHKYELAQKLEKLQDTKKDVSAFKVGDDGMKSYITITDAQGREFQTSNSDLLKAVIKTCIDVIDGKIISVEAEILQD